jgi:hypothetical protein
VKDSDLSYQINALAVSRWTGPDSVTRLRQNVMAPSFLAGLDLKLWQCTFRHTLCRSLLPKPANSLHSTR